MDSRSKSIGAMIIGATCIGFAPILVRWSEVGPSATAFYRLSFALPIYWLIACRQPQAVAGSYKGSNFRMLAAAGFFFAGDLAFWHWSLRFTNVANSTLLTNLAPIFVLIGARFFLHEKTGRNLTLCLAMAMAGAGALVANSAQLGGTLLYGDILAAITALFYAGYLLTLKRARQTLSTPLVMAGSGLVSTPLLLAAAVASGETLWPETPKGWAVVAALGFLSHLLGQGFIAYGLAHLPATFSAITLLWQPVVAAGLAAALLHEKLDAVQITGGTIVLLAIYLAQRSLPKSSNQ